MSHYPGEDPQQVPPSGQPGWPDLPPPAGQDPAQDGSNEPTEEVGYWERLARGEESAPSSDQFSGESQAQSQSQSQAEPTLPVGEPAYPSYDQGAGSPTPPGSNPYPLPGQYQQAGSYQQPGSYQQAGDPSGQYQQQPPWPVTPGAPSGYPYGPPAPDHPQANTAMILGLVGLIGTFICCVTVFLCPVAWVMGQRALKEIKNSGGRLGGEGAARTGQVTGIIGTVLMVLGVLGFVGFILLAATSSSTAP